MRRVGVAALLILHLIPNIAAAIISLDEWEDAESTSQSSEATLTAIETITDVKRVALTTLAEFTACMDKIIATECQWDLLILETTLKQSRTLVDNDLELLDIYYTKASIILKSRLSSENTEKVVQQAFDAELDETLRCLAHCQSWKNEAQKHWFWAKLYKTNIVDPSTWDQQQFQWDKFCMMVIKADNSELYKVVRHQSLDRISRNELLDYIIALDAANILTCSHSEMIGDIPYIIDLVVKHAPTRIINQAIPPHLVESANDLQKLFRVGYSHIPKLCLLLKNNGTPTIHPECAEWLIENNCVSLLKEIALENSHFNHDYCKRAIATKSLGTAKWLVSKNMHGPLANLMVTALRTGNLEAIKWLYDEFRDKMDWDRVFANAYYEIVLYDFIVKFLKDKTDLTPPVGVYLVLLLLAAEDDLKGLKAARPKTDFEWLQTTNVAVMRGNNEILKWAYKISGIPPPKSIVEKACERGNYSALHWMFKAKPFLSVPGCKFDHTSVLHCLLYATMQNNQEEMDWIWNNPLKGVKPSSRDHLSILSTFGYEEPLLHVFKRIITDPNDIHSSMLSHAIFRDHVQLFKWLCGKGLSITKDIVNEAIGRGRVKIIKAIRVIDPPLLCSEEAINQAKKCTGVWKYDLWDLIEKACGIPTETIDDKGFTEWKANSENY